MAINFGKNDRKGGSAQIVSPLGMLWNPFLRRVIEYDMSPAPVQVGAFDADTDHPWLSINGKNSADGDVAMIDNGGWRISVTTTADDEVSIVHNATNLANFLPTISMKPAIGVTFEMPAAITEMQIGIGLASDDDGDALFDGADDELDPNDATAPYDSAQIIFDTDDSDTFYRYLQIDDGSNTEANTPITAVVSTIHNVVIWVDDDDKPHYVMDGKEVYIGTAFTTNTNVLGPVVGLSALSTTTRTIDVLAMAFSCDFE